MDAPPQNETVSYGWSEASVSEVKSITDRQPAIDTGAPLLFNEDTFELDDRSLLFALRHGDSIKGTVSFRRVQNKQYIESLWIDSSVRGNPGIWRKLLQLCVAIAHEKSQDTLYAHTTFQNTRAQGIYERISSKRHIDMRLGLIEYTIPVENLKPYL
jgi:ribosomal protein S18 acetylase RimI-like enzyme